MSLLSIFGGGSPAGNMAQMLGGADGIGGSPAGNTAQLSGKLGGIGGIGGLNVALAYEAALLPLLVVLQARLSSDKVSLM